MNDMRRRSDLSPHGPVRRRLASSTRAMHLRLHESSAFASLMKGQLDQAGYVGLLQRLHGLHVLAESRIAPFDHERALAWRRRLPTDRPGLIRDDLAAFGKTPLPHHAIQDALCPFDTAIEALGCAWVIEGSSLGGRVMAVVAEKCLGACHGTGFFQGSVNQSARWRACCEAIEAFGHAPTHFAMMENAATRTFAAFDACLVQA